MGLSMDEPKKQNVLNIYIGYDEVETVAYHTLSQSIIKHASGPEKIGRLLLCGNVLTKKIVYSHLAL